MNGEHIRIRITPIRVTYDYAVYNCPACRSEILVRRMPPFSKCLLCSYCGMRFEYKPPT